MSNSFCLSQEYFQSICTNTLTHIIQQNRPFFLQSVRDRHVERIFWHKLFCVFKLDVIYITVFTGEWIRKQQKFLTALATLEHAPEAQSLPLQSFLILPMQHITRLPLLVDAILHQLDAQPGNQSSEDYAAVSRCLETLHSVSHLFSLLSHNAVLHKK